MDMVFILGDALQLVINIRQQRNVEYTTCCYFLTQHVDYHFSYPQHIVLLDVYGICCNIVDCVSLHNSVYITSLHN